MLGQLSIAQQVPHGLVISFCKSFVFFFVFFMVITNFKFNSRTLKSFPTTRNQFCSGFFEPWWQLTNQPAFLQVLSETIVIKDASSVKGFAQCTMKANSTSKMADHIGYVQAFVATFQSWGYTSLTTKLWCASQNRTCSLLVEKVYQRSWTQVVPA